MGIDIADALTEKLFTIYQPKHLLVRGYVRLWEAEQVTQKGTALAQIAEGKLADDKRVAENLPAVK